MTNIVTNWGKCCFELGQIRVTVITKWALQKRAAVTNCGKMCNKLGQVLQIRAITANWSMTVAQPLLLILLTLKSMEHLIHLFKFKKLKKENQL